MTKIHELLSARWSPRAFADRPVEDDKLRSLFEAARWAPSCYNDQPWRFVLTRRGVDAGHAKLLECLVPANQAWAATAPVLVLTVASQTFRHNGQPNRWAWYDAGLAVGSLLAQATALGLVAHQMAGFDAEAARAALHVPSGNDVVAVTALGYLGHPSVLPPGVEEKAQDKRERRALHEFVFSGDWASPISAE